MIRSLNILNSWSHLYYQFSRCKQRIFFFTVSEIQLQVTLTYSMDTGVHILSCLFHLFNKCLLLLNQYINCTYRSGKMFIVINIILNKKWQLPHFPQEGEDDSQIGGKRFVPKPHCMDYINFTLTWSRFKHLRGLYKGRFKWQMDKQMY